MILLSLVTLSQNASAELSKKLAFKVDSLLGQANQKEGSEKYQNFNKAIDHLQSNGYLDSANFYINLVLQNAKSRSVLGECLMYQALEHLKKEQFPSSIQQAKQALVYLNAASDERDPKVVTSKGEAYDILGTCFYRTGNMDSAFWGWNSGVEVYTNAQDFFSGKDSLDIMKKLPLLYNSLGVYFKNVGELDQAINQYKNALEVSRELNLIDGQIRSLGNIGNIFFYSLGDYEKSLEHYQLAFDLLIKQEETKGNLLYQSMFMNNIGLVYEKQGRLSKALNKFKNGLKFAVNSENTYAQAVSHGSLGNLLDKMNYADTSSNYHYNRALELYTLLGDKKQLAFLHSDLGHSNRRDNKKTKALSHFSEAERLYTELNLINESLDLYDTMSVFYADLERYNKAYEYLSMWVNLKDSLANKNSEELVREMSAKFDLEKKDLQIAQQEEKEKQRKVQLYIAVFVIILVLVFTIALFKQFKDKKKANELLQEQHDEIKHQRDQIFKQKEEITDSIEYASRIQSAILPPDQNISNMLPQHMIFYKPRDIVSGDFYWFNQQGDKVYFCAADCTGHGVPGAFMSMLGVTLLNEIVSNNKELDAAEILNQLRNQVVNSLHQTGKEGETQDGMDIAFCIIDKANMKLSFAGANNPVFIFRDGEIIEQKGDKMPIGVHIKQHVPFTSHEFDLKENDMIYTWSDGYVDQFGGPKEKKFLLKRFRQLLSDNHTKPMSQQYDALEETLKEWMGTTSQIDDILVLGAKVKF